MCTNKQHDRTHHIKFMTMSWTLFATYTYTIIYYIHVCTTTKFIQQDILSHPARQLTASLVDNQSGCQFGCHLTATREAVSQTGRVSVGLCSIQLVSQSGCHFKQAFKQVVSQPGCQLVWLLVVSLVASYTGC